MILVEIKDGAGNWGVRSERSCPIAARLEASSLANNLGADRVRMREVPPRVPEPEATSFTLSEVERAELESLRRGAA